MRLECGLGGGVSVAAEHPGLVGGDVAGDADYAAQPATGTLTTTATAGAHRYFQEHVRTDSGELLFVL
jgi:hypothetical protein